jgi:hypothetical protein
MAEKERELERNGEGGFGSEEEGGGERHMRQEEKPGYCWPNNSLNRS